MKIRINGMGEGFAVHWGRGKNYQVEFECKTRPMGRAVFVGGAPTKTVQVLANKACKRWKKRFA